jgi:GNAT superfamily N-acetyltransferase
VPVTFNGRLRTLGLQTDVALERDRAILTERDGFIAVRTPANPAFYFGNVLIFDRAPETGDADRWTQHFDDVFREDDAVRHAAFAWSIDEDAGRVDAFVERGYTFDERAVLTAQCLEDVPLPRGISVRPLRSNEDWEAQYALGLATREPAHEPQAYARFKAAQVAHHRHLAETLGVWLGAFDGDRLAGSCGIFPVEDVARYQDVGVFPDYRNRGIARRLIADAAWYARDRFGSTRLVIVAAADDFPRKMYERLGFTLFQREGALWIARR